MARRRRVVLVLAAAAAALALTGATADAASRPEVVLGVGHTAAIEGDPGGGGAALGLSLLWPLEDHFRVGLMGFADDLGERAARLLGPGGVDLGPVSGVHRAARGAGWRIEGHVPSRGFLTPYFSATWGYYRMDDDVRGVTTRRVRAAGFGLGAGVLRAINDRHSAGVAARYHQLSRGSTERYLTGALEWRWGRGATE